MGRLDDLGKAREERYHGRSEQLTKTFPDLSTTNSNPANLTYNHINDLLKPRNDRMYAGELMERYR